MRRIRAILLIGLLGLAGCTSSLHDRIARPMALAGQRAATSLEEHYGGALRNAVELDELRRDATLLTAHFPELAPDLDLIILNSPSINAFSLPPCRIYLTRGLLDLAPERSLRRAVIAHELAHLMAGDSFKPRPCGNETAEREVQADRTAIALLGCIGVEPAAMHALLKRIAPYQRPSVLDARIHALHATDSIAPARP